MDEPAIYVASDVEVRSKTNQLPFPVVGEEPPKQEES